MNSLKHSLFLKWWLFAMSMIAALVFCFQQGVFHDMYDKDFTKLSFILLALFIYMSVWCGNKTWKLSKYLYDYKGKHKESKKEVIDHIEHLTEVGWFTSDLFLTIGMIGTVVGFIYMLSGFATVDTADPKTVQGLIKTLGAGMSTSLYTTLSGLVYGALLKIQYFNLNQAIDRVQKYEKNLPY